MPAPTNLPPIITPGGNVVPTQQPYSPAAQPYVDNGLTYQSNNADFVERDDNGNIIINQGAEDNQNLVLEAMSLFYVNRSVVRNIDTRFKYFKFPPQNISSPEIEINLDDIIDPITAQYVPSANYTIASEQISTGILMDIVQQGLPQVFTNQYYISDVIKESGVDLRMQGRIRHRFATTVENANDNNITFYMMRRNGSTQFLIRNWLQLLGPVSVEPNTIKETYFDILIPNSDFQAGDSFQIGAEAEDFISGGVADHAILQEFTTWSTTDAAQNIELFGGFIGSIQVDNNTFATGTTPP